MTMLAYTVIFIMFTSINQWNFAIKLWDIFSYPFAIRRYIVSRKFLECSDISFIDTLEAWMSIMSLQILCKFQENN